MSLNEQGNLLKYLYQKKYYQQCLTRQTIKQSESLKHKLECNTNGNNNGHGHGLRGHGRKGEDGSQGKKRSSPEIMARGQNKIYDFQYCNVEIGAGIGMGMGDIGRIGSFRELGDRRTRKKAKSAAYNRELSNGSHGKGQHWVEQLKNSIMHSRQSYYINLLNQRKTKHKFQKTIDSSFTNPNPSTSKYPSNSNSNSNKIKYGSSKNTNYKTDLNFTRNTISEVRKRTTFTVLRNRSNNKTHEGRRDDNDVLPWNVKEEEFL